MILLNGVELPALEDGCANKKLLVRDTVIKVLFSTHNRRTG